MANWVHVFLDPRSEGTVTKTPSRPANNQVCSFSVCPRVSSLSFDLSRGQQVTISQPLGHPELRLPCLPSHQDSSSLFLPSLLRRPGGTPRSSPPTQVPLHSATELHVHSHRHTHSHTHTLIHTHSHSRINTHMLTAHSQMYIHTLTHTYSHIITCNHTASWWLSW